MNPCSNLFFLSSIVCRLSECLDEQELAVLSADLSVLGEMIAAVAVRKEVCKDD